MFTEEEKWTLYLSQRAHYHVTELQRVKETRSVTMNVFFEKKYFLFKSFVKIELSYVFTINMFSTAESCMEQYII